MQSVTALFRRLPDKIAFAMTIALSPRCSAAPSCGRYWFCQVYRWRVSLLQRWRHPLDKDQKEEKATHWNERKSDASWRFQPPRSIPVINSAEFIGTRVNLSLLFIIQNNCYRCFVYKFVDQQSLRNEEIKARQHLKERKLFIKVQKGKQWRNHKSNAKACTSSPLWGFNQRCMPETFLLQVLECDY